MKTCKIEGCGRKASARGLCKGHYKKWWLSHGGQLPPLPPRSKTCNIDGCERKNAAGGMCNTHYQKSRYAMAKVAPASGKKACSKCGKVKPIADFGFHGGASDGRRSECRKCHALYHVGRRKTIPNKAANQRRYTLKKAYGMTVDDYNSMFAAQDGRCAICGTHASGASLCIDHDHGTGDVRELLCGLCNKGLGSFKDDPARLKRAVDYLLRHKE